MNRSVVDSPKSLIGRSEDEQKVHKSVKENQPTEKVQPMHVIDLHDDCLSKIFGYFDIFDLVRTAASCRRFESIARGTFERTFAKEVVTVNNENATADAPGLTYKLLHTNLYADVDNNMFGMVKITNITEAPVTYNVKIETARTSSYRWSVTFIMATLEAGASSVINVVLQEGAQNRLLTNILSMKLPPGASKTSSNIAELWKNEASSGSSVVEEHPLNDWVPVSVHTNEIGSLRSMRATQLIPTTNRLPTKMKLGQTLSIMLLVHFGDLITKLRVDYTDPRCFNSELENAISEYCGKTAIEVEFKACNDFSLIRIERRFESVNKVLLTECNADTLITKFNKLFPNARSLDIVEARKFTDCIDQNFPQLDHLGIIAHRIVRVSSMGTIDLNPQLKSLTLNCRHTPLTSEDLSYISEKLPLLESLDVILGRSTSEQQIHFQNVQKLTIVFRKSSYLSDLRITTRLPVELTLIGKTLSRVVAGFLSVNQNWTKISLHGFWKSYENYEVFKIAIPELKLLSSIEMCANGLRGRESDVLALLDQCQSLNKFKVYSGEFFASRMKFMKAVECNSYDESQSVAQLAQHHAGKYGDTIVRRYTDDETFLQVYRREFELELKNSAWLPKYEANDETEGDYSWSEFAAVFEKPNMMGQ